MYSDMALINGQIYSPTKGDCIIRGEAVLIKDGHIQKICSSKEAYKYISESTEIIDCNNNTILPGLCDAHCHPNWSASAFESCQLYEVTGSPEETCDEVIDKYLNELHKYCQEHSEKEVVRGIGWNRAFFSATCLESRWPNRHDLDKICPDRPLVVESYCQHAIWVNSKAIELAQLSKETADPKYGSFIREEDGYPSGVFFEMEAQALIKDNLPNYDYSIEQYMKSIIKFQNEIATPYGITMLCDCLHTENATRAYMKLAENGDLNMRVRGVHYFSNCNDLSQIDQIESDIARFNVNDLFEINTIKIFVEGEFTTLEPYEAEAIRKLSLPEGYSGKSFYDNLTLNKAVLRAIQTGLQIHIHAMGDFAVRQAVRALVYAQDETGLRNRNVIAHLMLIDDIDLALMGSNEILANCQPRWMIYDSDADEYYTEMLGDERAHACYPNKCFLDVGCTVAYGTDYPVTLPPNPFHGIQCALTRSVFAGDPLEYERYKGTILGPRDNPTKECVNLTDAIKSNTWSGAYQLFLDDITGSIEETKSADIVILDRDLEKCPLEDIYKTKVVKTIFKGKVVYSI